MRADNSRHIVAAAHNRHEYTRAKAIQDLREIDAAGTAVTFDTVARAAGVCRSWLYTQPDLRAEIERLRGPTGSAPPRTRCLRGSGPPTLRCCGGWRQPTNATADLPRRTASSGTSSPARSATSAPAGYRARPSRRPDIRVAGRQRSARNAEARKMARRLPLGRCPHHIVPGQRAGGSEAQDNLRHEHGDQAGRGDRQAR